MKMIRNIVLLTILYAVVFASVPELMHFQGQFMDDTGSPIDHEHPVDFAIYNTETGGTAIWEETQTVSFHNGHMSVYLGEVSELPATIFDGGTKYIELSFDEHTYPRKPLITVPYSFRSTYADSFSGDLIEAYLDTMTVDFDLDTLGAYLDTTYAGSITHIDSVHIIDSIRVIDSVTYVAYIRHIDSISYIDSISSIDSIRVIDTVAFIDYIDYIDSVTYVDSIGWIGHTVWADSAHWAGYVHWDSIDGVPSDIGADSDWQVDGDDMHSLPSGNIGIGTTTPDGSNKLHVISNGSTGDRAVQGEYSETGPQGWLGTENYGAYGQYNSENYGALGSSGIGIHARGETNAAVLEGDVDITGNISLGTGAQLFVDGDAGSEQALMSNASGELYWGEAGSGSTIYIGDLEDVDTTGNVSTSILKYDGIEWVVGIDEVDDADSDPTNELAIGFTWDDLTNTLTYTDAGGAIALTVNDEDDDLSDNVLNDLGDVDASSPGDGQVLSYNSVSSEWTNQAVVNSLNSMTGDLSITGSGGIEVSETGTDIIVDLTLEPGDCPLEVGVSSSSTTEPNVPVFLRAGPSAPAIGQFIVNSADMGCTGGRVYSIKLYSTGSSATISDVELYLDNVLIDNLVSRPYEMPASSHNYRGDLNIASDGTVTISLGRSFVYTGENILVTMVRHGSGDFCDWEGETSGEIIARYNTSSSSFPLTTTSNFKPRIDFSFLAPEIPDLVTSVNSEIGDITIEGGTGIDVSTASGTVTISSAGSGTGESNWETRTDIGEGTNDTTLVTKGKWGIFRDGNTGYGNACSTHVNLGVACTTGSSGENNKYAGVLSGRENKAAEEYSVVLGGRANRALGGNSAVVSGLNNTASSNYSTILGGLMNNSNGLYSSITGGMMNSVNGSYSSVIGGESNSNNGDYSVIIGGSSNSITSNFSTVAGGSGIAVNGSNSFGFGQSFTGNLDYSAIFDWGSNDGALFAEYEPTTLEDSLITSYAFVAGEAGKFYGDIVGEQGLIVKGLENDDSPDSVLTVVDGLVKRAAYESGGADTDWHIDGSNMYAMPSGNIGIGISTPSHKLDINGNANINGNLFVTGINLGGVYRTTWPSGTGGDDWGTQVVQTSAELEGDGTASSPLGLAPQEADVGEVLKWNGSSWYPAPDIGGGAGDDWGSQTAATTTRISGDGTASSPLDIARNGATDGQVLKWDETESGWVPGTDETGDGSAIPSGMIAAFYRTSCPSGWTEATELRNTFLRGWNGSSVNTTGGSNSHSHTVNNHRHSYSHSHSIPDHDHSYSGSISIPYHTHSMTHTHAMPHTHDMPSHSHSFSGTSNSAESTYGGLYLCDELEWSSGYLCCFEITTATRIGHRHDYSGSTNSAGSGTTGSTTSSTGSSSRSSTSADGNGTYSFSGSTSDDGPGSTYSYSGYTDYEDPGTSSESNLPSYRTVIFCIKD